MILAGYYVGFIAGSRFAPPAIDRVGHVRVFAGLAALASAAVLVQVVFIDVTTWILLRFVVGMCISALYVVCETWMNGVATNRTRGGLFAAYMITVSAAELAGQILYGIVGFHGFRPFVLAAVLVSLSVVPVSLAVFPNPPRPEPAPITIRQVTRAAPLAVVGTFISGFTTAGILSAGVVYATEAGFNVAATAALVAAALAGGIVLQFPLGRWSDLIDRRVVIVVVATAAAIVALVASQVSTDRRLVLIALTTIAGGAGFPIYSLSVAHLNDYLDAERITAAGAHLVLLNGLGAIVGPIAGSVAIGLVSPGSMFGVLAGAYVVVGAYAAYRITRRSAAAEAARAAFSLAPSSLGPTTGQVPVIEAEVLYPVESSVAEVGELSVPYREQGLGAPVILIGDHDRRTGDQWHDMSVALAADGFRAIIPRLDAARWNGEAAVIDAVLGLLRHLELPTATFVGLGTGAHVAQSLADDYADRTDAIVVLLPVDLRGAPGEEREVSRPTLVIDEALLGDTPSDVADDIAEFIRPLLPSADDRRDTGSVEVVEI